MDELKPAKPMTDELVSRAGAERMMTVEMAVELGKTRALGILGPPADGKEDAIVIQHGRKAHRPGEPAWVVEHTNHNPHTKAPVPCHVLKYEDGTVVYLPMNVPGYPLDRVPLWQRLKGGHYCEWTYASAVRRSLKIKGRE